MQATVTARAQGLVALVTGAAGSIGAASARALVSAGAQVLLTDREQQPLAELCSELGAGHAAYCVADVTDSLAVSLAVAAAVERFGGLDVVFVNAGVFGAVAPIADYPEDVFQRVLAVNVLGAFLVCKHALPVIRPGGSVILNSSVVGLTSEAGICAYATSKHALVGLMRTAMHEVAERGVRVNTIHPGPVDNEFQHSIEMTATHAPRERAAELFEQSIPLRRHASATEIADLVLFLATRESAFITGATIAADGGMSA